jgi:hypothetical protein
MNAHEACLELPHSSSANSPGRNQKPTTGLIDRGQPLPPSADARTLGYPLPTKAACSLSAFDTLGDDMTDEDILAAATALAPLIAKTTTGAGGGMPTAQFPNIAAQILDLAIEISNKKHAKIASKSKFRRIV